MRVPTSQSRFAYRSVHLTALTAKPLLGSFYGQGPKFSYFLGSSDGGREALMEAQEFSAAFNSTGTMAGAACARTEALAAHAQSCCLGQLNPPLVIVSSHPSAVRLARASYGSQHG